ncbi:MAG: hypothetical protein C0597_08130, partial [Marinilabiliales bacterium]
MIVKNKNIIYAIILISGIMVFFLSPLKVQSQKNTILDSTIEFKTKSISLFEGLNQISKTINYEFSYNADLIATESRIKVDYDKIAIGDLLTSLLSDSTLTFQAVDKQIIIHKKHTFNTLSSLGNVDYNNNLFRIKGSIFDQMTKDPLAYANVALYGKSIGSITNEQGQFNLNIKEENFSDTLVISYIGYRNTYIPVNQLSLYNNRIYMEEDIFKIQEVVIRIDDPRLILREAIDKVKENYFTDPYYITSFYREIVTNRDELASISEAVIEVYKSPYLGLYSDQVRLMKSRKNEYYTNEDTISLKLKGGLYASLYLDAIKNPSNFLRKEYLYTYDYTISGIVNFDDNTAYVIKFKPKYYLEDQTFEGKIFVNTENLAIVAIEFNVAPEAIKRIGGSLVVKKKFGTIVKPTSAKYVVNYRKINDKYFINLVRGELDFKIKYKRKLFSSEFKTIFEFASNNIDTLDVERFNRIETISSNNVFIDEDFKYDYQ